MAQGLDWSLAVKGSLQDILAVEVRAGREAATYTIKARVDQTKNRIRAEVRRGGLGDRLANAVRGEVYPTPPRVSLDATGRVYSKAYAKRRTGVFDLIYEFTQAAEITGKDGRRYLAIPTRNTPRLTGRRRTLPEDFPPGFLQFVKVASAGSFIEGARGAALLIGKDDRVYFVLVRKVRRGQRLNLDAIIADWDRGLSEAIVADWKRRAEQGGARVARAA